jgi:hypothetical protein
MANAIVPPPIRTPRTEKSPYRYRLFVQTADGFVPRIAGCIDHMCLRRWHFTAQAPPFAVTHGPDPAAASLWLQTLLAAAGLPPPIRRAHPTPKRLVANSPQSPGTQTSPCQRRRCRRIRQGGRGDAGAGRGLGGAPHCSAAREGGTALGARPPTRLSGRSWSEGCNSAERAG